MKFIRWVDSQLEETLVIILMAVFVSASVLQVITRFIPQVNGTWTEEVARYAFIWMTFIGSAVAAKWDIHVRVDLVDLVIKDERARKILNVVSKVVFMVFLALALRFGIAVCSNLIKRPQMSPVLQINMIWVYTAMPLGMALTIFRMIQKMWRDRTKGVKGSAK